MWENSKISEKIENAEIQARIFSWRSWFSTLPRKLNQISEDKKLWAHILAPVLNEIIENGASALVVTCNTILVNQIVDVAVTIMSKIEHDLDLKNENRIGFGNQIHSSSLGVASIGKNDLISNVNKTRNYLILDESDFLFSSEYFDKTMNLIDSMSENCRIICVQPFWFSEEQVPLVRSKFRDAKWIETDSANRIPLHVNHFFKHLKGSERDVDVVKLLRDDPTPTLLFANRKRELYYIQQLLDMYRHVLIEKKSRI